jgi:hypothetical protein
LPPLPIKRSSISAFDAGYDQAFGKTFIGIDHGDVFASGTFDALDPLREAAASV